MKIIVAGDILHPILLDTDKATALLIETDDGQPQVIIRILPNGNGYLRLFKGEDTNFDSTAKELGLTKKKK
jgi:hypothetical protein